MASFRKRGKKGLWQYRITYKDIEGKEREISKGGFRTKVEAVNEANEIEQSLKSGYKYGDKTTLAEYFKKWLNTFKARKVSMVTVRKYEQTLKHIVENFPDIPMMQITSIQYQEFLNQYADTHVKSSTLRLNGHIKQALRVALADKIIIDDFTRNAVISGKKKSKSSKDKFISYEDTKRLLNYLITNRDPRKPNNYLLAMAFLTGLRFGELLGLTWLDIDHINQTISINKSYDYIYSMDFKETKTETSTRIIDIDKQILQLLTELKIFQQQKMVELQLENPLNQVFFNYIEGVPSNSGVNKLLKMTLKKLEIEPNISIHGARHTFGSILLFKGTDIAVVSEILGHKDVTVTNEVYRHVVKELREKNRKKFLGIQYELLSK
ncbi:site-specific integrase [Enterococcus faecium]|nr:tyrosine-type recombinase/integrase [Enterococcus faecium]EGP5366374.1 site-specific integrase [Enterococcus faecium]NTQ55437.1 site-specific integrase [Enterococcus faecium]